MSHAPIGLTHQGEILALIDRHAITVVQHTPEGPRQVRVPKPLTQWRKADADRFRRLEQLAKKSCRGAEMP